MKMKRSNFTNTLEKCKNILRKAKNSFGGKYHLYSGETLNWFQVVLRLESSVIPVILPWVIFCGVYGFLVSLLHYLGLSIAFPEGNRVLTNAVLSFNVGLSLLLVFRTNTAHERFWEGRKLWGALVNTVRNLTQEIYVVVKEQLPKDRVNKEAILRLIVAFPVAMKLHLRAEPLDEQLALLMSEKQYCKLKDVNHPPLQIAFWIRNYLQYQYERNCLNIYQLNSVHNLLNSMIDILGGCERILKTPMPLIYAIKLRLLVLIYCLILPLELVTYSTWWTGIIIAFVSFTLLSIEQIGSEIEEPFGLDPNDLPLNAICNTMQRNVEELIRVTPNKDTEEINCY
jgi:ion channel-forming bestrophin family protein